MAEHFGDDDGVTIASMDGTAHPPPADIAGDIQGYPTILFFRWEISDSKRMKKLFQNKSNLV